MLVTQPCVCVFGPLTNLCVCLSSRKLYWTDGDNISIANTDGSNRSVLFTNQKGPVGECPSLIHGLEMILNGWTAIFVSLLNVLTLYCLIQNSEHSICC